MLISGTLELPGLLNTLEADYKHELLGEGADDAITFCIFENIWSCNRTCAFVPYHWCAVDMCQNLSKT